MMMSVLEISEVLSTIKFFDLKIRVHNQIDGDRLVLSASFTNIDSTGEFKDQRITIAMTRMIRRPHTPEELILEVRQMIHEIVIHETDEFLEICTKKPFDPHLPMPDLNLLRSMFHVKSDGRAEYHNHINREYFITNEKILHSNS